MPVRRKQRFQRKFPLFTTACAALLVLAAGGCGDTLELNVPAREIRCWPSDQYAQIQAQPDDRYFVLNQRPPRLFFRPGGECGKLECLQIAVAGWPAGADALREQGEQAGLAGPPAVQYYLTDRHARADARFTPAQAIDWEPRGGREAIEVRATAAGSSPTPVAVVPFETGWVYRVTILAQFGGGSSVQRTIWLGPEAWRERALAAN